MQVSFTAHAPNHSMLTIQQRLEAAGFTNVHVNAISDSTQPFTRTTGNHRSLRGRQTTHGSTIRPLRRHGRSPTHQPLPRRRPMNWRHQAACRDHDPELWFSGNPFEQAAALAVCRQCPVIDECRQFADHNNRINGYPLQGIWGGRQYGVKGRPRKAQQ